jgi:hypothetical protein
MSISINAEKSLWQNSSFLHEKGLKKQEQKEHTSIHNKGYSLYIDYIWQIKSGALASQFCCCVAPEGPSKVFIQQDTIEGTVTNRRRQWWSNLNKDKGMDLKDKAHQQEHMVTD